MELGSETSELRPHIKILLPFLLLLPEELPTQICALPCHSTNTSLGKHLALLLWCPIFNGIDSYFLMYYIPEVWNCFSPYPSYISQCLFFFNWHPNTFRSPGLGWHHSISVGERKETLIQF